jgi:hypothetical protein
MVTNSEKPKSGAWEKTGRVSRLLIKLGKRFVEIEWDKNNKKIYPEGEDKITDFEWDIFKLAYTTGKPIVIKNSPPYIFENLKDFHKCVLEVN